MADAAVTTTIEDGVAVLRFDDGKVNALSYAVLDTLSEGLDRAKSDARAVCIVGRAGVFSAGFDLSVMRQGIDEAMALAAAGGKLLLRLYLHPQPVVAAVTGHALAAGVLLVATCDVRIGADVGKAKLGLNETAIGMSLPSFAVELARDRITPKALSDATLGAEIYDPDGAVEVGWLDRVVAAEECVPVAIAEARRLGEYSPAAYAQTKWMLREPTVERARAGRTRDDFKVE
ncbi:MAG: crotonase/enoyl-CoA hydratase family protein [Acidimicrobiales bacterium]